MTRATTICLAVLAVCGLAPAAATAQADDQGPAYALANGCYGLKSVATGKLVATAGDGYAASAGDVAGAQPWRMQAVTLGRFMFYGPHGEFLAMDGEHVTTAGDGGPATDWRVEATGTTFRVSATPTGKALVAGPDGRLALADASSAGDAGAFAFVPAEGCATFPEAEIDATGEPAKGATPYSQVRGFIDAHMHMMGFEFLGGELHCGRPWDPYGITHALAGCPRTEVASPPVEAFLSGDLTTPVKDPVGWPTFKDWPRWNALTHEQSYYKWLERAWRGGLRIFVNLYVENHALCELYPHRKPGYNCNEMDSVRREARDLHELERYIDAQNGGPGKGWFRIVEDPFEARRVINDGKLAVVPGIEVSNLFDCGVKNGIAQCDAKQVDDRLDEAYNTLGVRDMELINKFDNGFAGVAGDNALTGVLVNTGNKLETGQFWQMQPCKGPSEESDHPQFTVPVVGDRSILGDALQQLLPGGLLPIYQAGPMCNARPLTTLGEHLVRRMIEKRMIIDPDHLDVISRKQLLSIVEAAGYSGIVSSHSWSTADAYPRIYKAGGFVAPYAGGSESFVAKWRKLRTERDPRYYWGFGWGADMNGFGAQGPPRGPDVKNPVKYPFKSFDGTTTFERQRTGSRVFDINTDGVAHYGLYPDWVEDLRQIAGDQIVEDLARGPEAYLEMWERAVGVRPSDDCRSDRLRITADGVSVVRLGVPAEELLRGAGQPRTRVARAWGYCVTGRSAAARGRLRVAFAPDGTSALVASTAAHHRIGPVGRGSRASLIPASARRFGAGILVRGAGKGRRYVYGVRAGRVRFAGVATAAATKSPARLRTYLKLAGL